MSKSQAGLPYTKTFFPTLRRTSCKVLCAGRFVDAPGVTDLSKAVDDTRRNERVAAGHAPRGAHGLLLFV
jgi:hypothetical protein